MKFEIKKVAELARLNLAPEEAEKIEKDLESILDYVKKLDSLDTAHVTPTSHVLDLENVFRPDQVQDVDIRTQALAHAPSREGNFFKVPKIVEKE